ncbi:MAG: AAA family ATPase [Bacteroidales bacterium]|nr:AAA family ATPase [Bacteroidales bacterium]
MLYPIGIQDFEKIRKDGFVYVDKTELIYNMAEKGGYYFLSRPRRFGKSLLVSTMEAYFSGRKELFDGLAIADLEKNWNRYPVLRIDFSGEDYSQSGSLGVVLSRQLKRWEDLYGMTDIADTLSARFKEVIDVAYAKTGNQVVILIDEYDKPIVDSLGDEKLNESFRSLLQAFYGVMKAKDGCIRFGFLTGVTKIGKLSVFSGLNNLKDISMDARYTDICGISETDLKKYFAESVKELAQANGLSEQECYEKLALMYDGYHFRQNSEGVYNPFSVLNTFDSGEFKEYWFETGTPTFLVKLMQETYYDVTRLSDEEIDAPSLMDVDTVYRNPIPLLYQSGYLTIKGYEPEYGMYHLGFPNREVRHGFLNFLSRYYTPSRADSGMMLVSRMLKDLRSGNAEGFMQKLEALFAKTSYQIQGDSEKDFQYAMYIILELMGEYAEVERATSNGRIDILIQTKEYIYIIEIKINDTVEAALQQIEDKGYERRFAGDSRRIFKIGVRFSTDSRCIDDWKIAEQTEK